MVATPSLSTNTVSRAPGAGRRLAGGAGLVLLAAGTIGLTVGVRAAAGTTPDAAIVEACLWGLRVAAGWLLFCVLVTVVAAVTRADALASAAARISPRWMIRLTALALGSGVVAGTATPALAGEFGHGHARPVPAARSSSGLPGLGWAEPSPQRRARPPDVAPPAAPTGGLIGDSRAGSDRAGSVTAAGVPTRNPGTAEAAGTAAGSRGHCPASRRDGGQAR
jgi:hypothetical protein